MQSIFSTLVQTLRRAVLVLALVCSFSALGWFSAPPQPSYAATKPAATQEATQDAEDREEAYEEAKDIADDPKMGIEKEYEKEVQEYRKEHSDGGILEGAKDLVKRGTGN